MSPWSIIVETCRETLKPLLRIAIVMAVLMLMPDSGSAAASQPLTGTVQAAEPAALTLPPRHDPEAEPQPFSAVTVAVDLGLLPASAFGDHDDFAR